MKEIKIGELNVVNMLQQNHNIILHGAPGTGKTYLAREIAKAMCGVDDIKKLEESGQFKMVQFHPSYDYTDFVEGLRPCPSKSEDDKIVFERKDGVFKEFCKKAIENKCLDIVTEKELEKAWGDLLSQFDNDKWVEIALQQKGYTSPIKKVDDTFIFVKNKQKTKDDKKNQEVVTYKTFSKLFEKFDYKMSAIKDVKQADFADIIWCKPSANAIRRRLYEIILANKPNETSISVTMCAQQPFIFLIDEINRGDMSKIFGELFFSIDPGYRVKKGEENEAIMITTQYQNLVKKTCKDKDGNEFDDPFYEGFYIPDNVYIIGTMNDIDRSVESMDFAMRRRFQFIEVKPKHRADSMFYDEKCKKDYANAGEAKAKMNALNEALKTLGFDESYYIGPSYFMKLAKGEESVIDLWNYRLKGLLREYLRGYDDADSKIEKLKKAFNDTSVKTQKTDSTQQHEGAESAENSNEENA